MTKIIVIMIFVIIEQPYPKQCAFGYVRYKIASENRSRTEQIQRWSTTSYIPVQIKSQKSKSRTISMILSYDWITSDAVTELDLDVVCCQILKNILAYRAVTITALPLHRGNEMRPRCWGHHRHHRTVFRGMRPSLPLPLTAHALHARTSASVSCVLLRTVRSMCITAPWQNRRFACAYRRTRQSPRQQHGQGGKGTDICSLSFGHSLSLLSYSTSKWTLLHSNAAPAPPPNWASSIGYSTCKTL